MRARSLARTPPAHTRKVVVVVVEVVVVTPHTHTPFKPSSSAPSLVAMMVSLLSNVGSSCMLAVAPIFVLLLRNLVAVPSTPWIGPLGLEAAGFDPGYKSLVAQKFERRVMFK